MSYIDYSPPLSQLLCPYKRTRQPDRFRETKLDGTSYHIVDNSYYIDDAREGDKESSHFHQLSLLLWCNNKEDKENDFHCEACGQNTIGTIYYYCSGCSSNYHKECVESPAVFISPCHPKYPLQLYRKKSLPFRFSLFDNDMHRTEKRQYCRSCGKQIEDLVYYSSICDLILHPVCASKRGFPAINTPKRHEHTLHYFPRKASLACDVCGMDDDKICFYICHQCDYVVHKTCIDLPHVIQTSRHSHRLFFTSSLSSGIWSCKVCRQKIDGIYGAYSCSKGCAYAMHSKCATQDDVWDGKELEDLPEKAYDNINSWEEVSDGIIKHFSHPHHNMRFDAHIDKAYYENKQCEACLFPLYDGSIYRCMQCEFVLHEACANLPRIKQNMLHAHPFILESGDSGSYFSCKSCGRLLSGFRYNCLEGCNIILDVKCASLSEPVHHESHPDPLFLLYTNKVKERCSVCGELCTLLLNCIKCLFGLCFRCATLPYKVKHKVDEHLLTLTYEENAICTYLCQICEEMMDPKKGYYACSECGATFHIQCILGVPNMKPGQMIDNMGVKLDIIPNNRLVRPICDRCKRRCQYKLVFKMHGMTFCSHSELPSMLERVIWASTRTLRATWFPPASSIY